MKKIIKFLAKTCWVILGVLFFPVFVFGWLLLKAAVLTQALAFGFMLDFKFAYRTLKQLFR